MNLTNEQKSGVTVVRIGETRMMYPLLADFSGAIAQLLSAGHRRMLLDFTKVTYVDSATIGCLMDLYRQTTAAGGTLKLLGVQKRVETMLTMTGAHNFLEMFADEGTAVGSFGS
jgi:anti-anti-sigma factor